MFLFKKYLETYDSPILNECLIVSQDIAITVFPLLCPVGYFSLTSLRSAGCVVKFSSGVDNYLEYCDYIQYFGLPTNERQSVSVQILVSTAIMIVSAYSTLIFTSSFSQANSYSFLAYKLSEDFKKNTSSIMYSQNALKMHKKLLLRLEKSLMMFME